ncbi:hypothetical protein E4U42_002316 [Claviceps africana]|uniref:Uncharacterized protein n=1 Tax=Claviceps africana TaxID=83212 RepID=A0A8K0JAV5_9HYPO|nr:hypothetical protein E4U42_002316 [Claviceps africana]
MRFSTTALVAMAAYAGRASALCAIHRAVLPGYKVGRDCAGNGPDTWTCPGVQVTRGGNIISVQATAKGAVQVRCANAGKASTVGNLYCDAGSVGSMVLNCPGGLEVASLVSS